MDTRRFHPLSTQPGQYWIGVACGWQNETKDPLDRLISLPPKRLTTHALLLGATGSGKTTLLHSLIAQDILAGHSFIVLDLRGDLIQDTVQILAGSVPPETVRHINLREKVRPTGFNPLGGVGEPYYQALGVLDALKSEAENWGPQIDEVLRAALMLLSETGEPLTQMEALFYDARHLSRLIDRCPSERTTAFWVRYLDLSMEKQATLAMPVMNKVSPLLSTETLRQILRHPNPIDLKRHLEKRGSVLLVSLAVDELHGAARMFGRMLLSSVSREIFARVDTPEEQRNPVRLVVDEFEHFGTHHFEPILAEGRRFKFHLLLAHQTLAQLSPKMRALILGNVGAKVVFRLGRDDSSTMSFDLTGDRKAIDFAELPTGMAVAWAKGVECIPVEINAPLVKHRGVVSPEVRRFIDAVRAQGGDDVRTSRPPVAPLEDQIGGLPIKGKPASTSPESRGFSSNLEDWLSE